MKRRQRDGAIKAKIVMEGFRGWPVAELCTEHQISQSQYYKWRDKFLANVRRRL